MARKELARILWVWRAGLISEQECRLALAHLIRGEQGSHIVHGIRVWGALRSEGIVG